MSISYLFGTKSKPKVGFVNGTLSRGVFENDGTSVICQVSPFSRVPPSPSEPTRYTFEVSRLSSPTSQGSATILADSTMYPWGDDVV